MRVHSYLQARKQRSQIHKDEKMEWQRGVALFRRMLEGRRKGVKGPLGMREYLRNFVLNPESRPPFDREIGNTGTLVARDLDNDLPHKIVRDWLGVSSSNRREHRNSARVVASNQLIMQLEPSESLQGYYQNSFINNELYCPVPEFMMTSLYRTFSVAPLPQIPPNKYQVPASHSRGRNCAIVAPPNFSLTPHLLPPFGPHHCGVCVAAEIVKKGNLGRHYQREPIDGPRSAVALEAGLPPFV